jgi:hypothetical protein
MTHLNFFRSIDLTPSGSDNDKYSMQYINLIEINSTFYRSPVIRNSLSWVKKIENYPDFLLSIKLHQIFTLLVPSPISSTGPDSTQFEIVPSIICEFAAVVMASRPTNNNVDTCLVISISSILWIRAVSSCLKWPVNFPPRVVLGSKK